MLPILDILSPVINKILDFIPDPKAKAEALAKAQEAAVEHEEKIMAAFLASDAAQNKVNEVEASSTDKFTSRWRPAAGWVCVVSLALYFWPRFILGMAFWCIASWRSHVLVPLPEMGIGDIMGMLGSLLGMGGMRMMEKKWGVASK